MIVYEDGYLSDRPEGGRPGDLPPVEVNCPCDEFENAIRKFGIVNACEWFGTSEEFIRGTIMILRERGKS